MTFRSKLVEASTRNQSLLCVGLDPDPSLIPANIDVATFNCGIIEATKDLVCAYKPNLAFYEAQGMNGLKALQQTLAYIPKDIPVIGDAKRGDVGNTAQAYAKAMFDEWGFDAVTVHPYIGWDSVAPFAKYSDKGVFILCRTSNSSAVDFQDLPTSAGPHDPSGDTAPLYMRIAFKVGQWDASGNRNLGLVVGATYPEELKRIRQRCPDLPILIPGVGAQGGDLSTAVQYGTDRNGQLAIISSSREILYSSKDADYANAARQTCESLRGAIEALLGTQI
ncbi:orotidine-5'-phosphate decarboxylase [Dehalococcoidia bacterium]|nr:orotidine-5'-phosphate decarboxylase [Dehalococcoidia bacterium]